jgi:cellulose synthase/poly-beta-1,6-N-acetylglucosamine synthase-like glycosyltransferase
MEWPLVDVVVPVHDEALQIAGKIENLRQLDYPAERIMFWIVDGASADATRRITGAVIGGDPRFVLLEADVADKTAQLNIALPRCEGDWILVTDADARLASDTLKRLLREGMSNPRTGAVGASVIPLRSHPWERLYWQIADRIRLREAARGSASIVTGPCYLMRRGLVKRFPASVVAEDVHVAFCAAASGLRTGFIDGGVVELRAPLSIAEMLRHKFRKAHAYVREILRFLPRAFRMPAPFRTTFLWRATQMLLFPFAGAASLGLLIAIAARLGRLSPLLLAGAAGAAAAVSTLILRRRPAARALIALATLLTVVLLAAIVASPFIRQRASFRKIDEGRAPTPEFETS